MAPNTRSGIGALPEGIPPQGHVEPEEVLTPGSVEDDPMGDALDAQIEHEAQDTQCNGTMPCDDRSPIRLGARQNIPQALTNLTFGPTNIPQFYKAVESIYPFTEHKITIESDLAIFRAASRIPSQFISTRNIGVIRRLELEL
ncbi:hypothetical protein MMC22_005169 [Lobaria immixta]|nr:hypothetical protein [Lobaria immixta]